MGDHAAEQGLATLYDLGKGVTRDAAAAYGWYRRAAEAGVVDAEFNVAVMRDDGDGTPRDLADAALWYARAASHGSRRAEYNLAQLYASGEGVPRNLDAARTWFRIAATALPAAADKLAGLSHGAAPLLSAADATGGLKPVQLAAPADGSTVTPLRVGDRSAIELVWTAPAQPAPSRFFVQVVALDETRASLAMHEVFAGYIDQTATLAAFSRTPGRYAWRVYAVTGTPRHYAASRWARFTVPAGVTSATP